MFSQGMAISDRAPMQSLLRICITIFSGFALVGPSLGMLIASIFYEGSLLSDMATDTMEESMVVPLLIMQALATFIGLIVFPIIHITLLEHKPLSGLFNQTSGLRDAVPMVALLALAFAVAISPTIEWNANAQFPEFLRGFEQWARQKEGQLTRFTELLTGFDTVGGLIVGLVVIAILPAIGEELAFRGMIQKELWRGTGNIHIAVWVSAFIFSAIHMQFFGFVPRLLLGALFGYLYYWSGNLIVPIVAHFVNNAFGVILIYLANTNVISPEWKEAESAPWSWVVIGAVIAVLLLVQLKRLYMTTRSGQS